MSDSLRTFRRPPAARGAGRRGRAPVHSRDHLEVPAVLSRDHLEVPAVLGGGRRHHSARRREALPEAPPRRRRAAGRRDSRRSVTGGRGCSGLRGPRTRGGVLRGAAGRRSRRPARSREALPKARKLRRRRIAHGRGLELGAIGGRWRRESGHGLATRRGKALPEAHGSFGGHLGVAGGGHAIRSGGHRGRLLAWAQGRPPRGREPLAEAWRTLVFDTRGRGVPFSRAPRSPGMPALRRRGLRGASQRAYLLRIINIHQGRGGKHFGLRLCGDWELADAAWPILGAACCRNIGLRRFQPVASKPPGSGRTHGAFLGDLLARERLGVGIVLPQLCRDFRDKARSRAAILALLALGGIVLPQLRRDFRDKARSRPAILALLALGTDRGRTVGEALRLRVLHGLSLALRHGAKCPRRSGHGLDSSRRLRLGLCRRVNRDTRGGGTVVQPADRRTGG